MKFFDDYFVFSVKEKKGILALVIIILLMIVTYRLIPILFTQPIQDFSEAKAQIEAMNLVQEKKEALELFYFNPNTISLDSLLLLGLSKRQAYTIKNYREKVGDFKKKEDLRKMYSIPDSLASKLIPFVILEENTEDKEPANSQKSEKELVDFNPNTATEFELKNLGFTEKQIKTLTNYRSKGGKFKKKEDLKKVYSITEQFYQELEPFIQLNEPEQTKELIKSKSIELNSANFYEIKTSLKVTDKQAGMVISYREKLGGYTSISQLNEVYGLENFDLSNLSEVSVNTQEIRVIDINEATFKELVAHPYLSFSDVKKIVNYREMHGEFSNLEQIHQNNLINLKQYRKIAPYLIL